MKINRIEIPKDDLFDLPEGTFRAKISEVKPTSRQKAKGTQDWVRFLFDVEVPALMRKYNPRAGRNFEKNLHPGSDLRNFLIGLLGRKYFNDRAGEEFEFDSLVGIDCEVELAHRETSKYDKPFVMITNVKPIGVRG